MAKRQRPKGLGKKQERDPMALKPREAVFVLKYLELENATEAYLQAGYAAKKRDVAGACAARLLTTARVKAAVDQARARVIKKLELDVEASFRALNDAVRFDPAKLYNEDSSLKPIREWPDEVRHVVRALKEKDYGTEITFPDKVRVAERILEATGHLKRKVEVDVDLFKLLAEDASEEDRK
jgi:phage terminase small subunit